jgi:hypothetical protein
MAVASHLISPSLVEDIISTTESKDCDVEVIGLPLKMYVLGLHTDRSPWGEQYKKILIKRGSLNITDIVHKEIGYSSTKLLNLPPKTADSFLYHLTHETPSAMFERHARYTKIEAHQLIKRDNKILIFGLIYDLLMALFLLFVRRKSFLMGSSALPMSLSFLSYPIMKYIQAWHLSKHDDSQSYEFMRTKLTEKWMQTDEKLLKHRLELKRTLIENNLKGPL